MIIQRTLLFFGFILLLGNAFTQNLNDFDRQSPFITAEFRKTNLVIEPESSFFNVLMITNQGNRSEDVFVEINVPLGWSVMNSSVLSYTILPGDTVRIPVRAAPSKDVEGEIGYSLIASIRDQNGDTYTNAYCFIKIPKKSDFLFRPITRVSYFDQQTNRAELSFLLSNKGNVNELVYLSFTSTQSIILQNESENMLEFDVVVQAQSDTIINIPVILNTDQPIFSGSLYRADLEGNTEETTFRTSFWFSQLSSVYRYTIPQTEKMLIAEIAAQNLLNEQPSTLAGGVKGAILLPQKRDINYMFYRFGSGPGNDFLRYSRTLAEYNSPKLSVSLGDVTSSNLKYGSGKGARISYRFFDDIEIGVMGNRNIFQPINNVSATVQDHASPYKLKSFYSFSENEVFDNTAHVGGLGGSFSFLNTQRIRIEGGVSNVTYNQAGFDRTGYGINVEYSGRFSPKTTLRVREQFGSSDYYGHFSGRHNLMANFRHQFNDIYNLQSNINDYQFRPLIESAEGINDSRFIRQTSVNMILRRYFEQDYTLYAGPVYERKSTNIFYLFEENDLFTTQSAKLSVGGRLSDGYGLSFNPNITFGYTFVTNYTLPEDPLFNQSFVLREKNFFNSLLSINLRKNFWGIYLNYFYGPYSVNQELSQFYNNLSTHSIRLMPFYERFIYKDFIQLSSRLGILYDFSFQTTRLNLSNQLNIFLKNDFQINFLNNISYQATTDRLTDERYTYSNNYFEVRLIKEFNWNQPRVKYYDLNLELFKDLNGNLTREFNEPGVRDILVSINSIDPVEYSNYDPGYEYSGNLIAARLLTGSDGKVVYENLNRGLYRIKLENIGKEQDKYFPDENEFIINVNEDKTEVIPYLERNRIFGEIVMNRSKLSNLGRIELGNIKITAVDSKGRSLSTLTDASGKFEMYVPSIDSYVVSINNIFEEHFNLRQNDFRADLNGFKQFEVTFVFDEIRRSIEFTPPSQVDVPTEIRRLGRTNLSGLIRDASTLQPLRAQVEVVNTQTGTVLASTFSNRSTGEYNTSFATGEGYMLIVTADTYWLNSQRLILDQFLTIQDVERDVLMERISVGSRFNLNNLRFEMRSSEIPTEAMPELDRLINQLKENPNVRIRVEGHSDPLEQLDNPDLSEERASSVREYMIRNGFSNVEVIGLGDSQPVAPNNNEVNRERNRRVEIIVIDR